MEISNRNLVIASASIILFGISLRVQSGSLSNPAQPNSNFANSQSKPIPNSDFNVLNKYEVIPETPIERNLGGIPNQKLIKQNQAGAIVPGVTHVQDDSLSVSGAQSGLDNGNGNPIVQDFNGSETTASGGITGNRMLDTAAGSLDDDDQAGFAMMWSGMTEAQKEQFMARLRQNR